MGENGVSIELNIFTDGKQIVFDYEPVYDIILMDVEMPGLDGMSAAEKISFEMELKEAIGTLSRKKNDSLLFPGEDGLVKVMVGDIYYLESQKHHMLIHTKNGVIKIRETMKNMEKKLAEYYFERCNVSYLINLSHINGIVGDYVDVEGEQIPISRQKRKGFIAALSAYVGGGSSV